MLSCRLECMYTYTRTHIHSKNYIYLLRTYLPYISVPYQLILCTCFANEPELCDNKGILISLART